MTDSSSAKQFEVRTVQDLSQVLCETWQALDGSENPFSSWHFLAGLERTGCVCPERGWWPMHLTAWLDGTLVAAAPAYVKGDGMGDFSRDWGYQEALQQLGGHAYPKLVVGVPFSPVTGPRILVAPSFDPKLATKLLMDLAREVAKAAGLGCVQVLYHSAAEAPLLAESGLATRTLMQYHWQNYQYRHIDDWLSRLPGRKRKQIRKEMLAPETQGIAIRTWRASESDSDPGEQSEPDDINSTLTDAKDMAQLAFELYRTTCEKYMWGGTYLNRQFFNLMFTDPFLSKFVELVTATRAGSGFARDVVAGAINLATPSHLYGRYWGCHEEHRFLHFNVCLYHSIGQCVDRNVKVFEGGAGGEHKISRGFEPTIVYHSLWFAKDQVHDALSDALERDATQHMAAVERWRVDRGLDPERHP